MSKTKKSQSKNILLLVLAVGLIIIGIMIINSRNIKSLPKTGTPVPSPVISHVVFNCDDKKTIDATFTKDQIALKLSDGRDLTVPEAISASGARYANQDESFVFWNKGSTSFIQEGQPTTYANCETASLATSPTNTVSIKGEMVCLPHKNSNGPQTMECAYGLKADNGNYYGLKDSDPMYKNISGVSINKKVEITGSISLQSDTKYDTIGTILVNQIKPQ